MKNFDYDVMIGGAGPVGLACALNMKAHGWKVAIVDPTPEAKLADPSFDGREIAMTYRTRDSLKRLGVWQRFDKTKLCPMDQARIETGHLGGPALIFEPFVEDMKKHFADVSENEKDEKVPLGWLMANHLIKKALYEQVKAEEIPIFAEDSIKEFHVSRDQKTMHATLSKAGEKTCRLLVAADGRFSKMRDHAKIGIFLRDFFISVLVCRVAHEKPHDNVALQWFDDKQTLALLPVLEKTEQGEPCSSVVLMLPHEEIGRLNNLSEEEFNREISERTDHLLGNCRLISRKVIYPLKTVYAHRFYEKRLALIGDAAVGMHPVTAHGFNFGVLAQDILVRAIETNKSADPGDIHGLREYSHALRSKTFPMYSATNVIAQLYSRRDKPSQFLRKVGIEAAQKFTPFRRRIVNNLMEAH